MRRNIHLRAKAQSMGKAAELGGTREVSAWDDTANFLSGEVPFANLKETTPEIRANCEQYLSEIYRWVEAAGSWIDPLKASVPNKRIVAASLQIHVDMNIIILLAMSFTSETSFDELLSEF